MHTFANSSFSKQAFCFKCDLSKAFDRMEWNFVVRVLQLYGFPPIFVSWILNCITSASFALLINGAADGFITPTRGLRQGCALSPYLFILCMDILNRMFELKIHRGLITGCSIARGAPAISSILYADDILICGMANIREVQEIKLTIVEFCAMSGQCIGADKSRIWFSKCTLMDMRNYCMSHFQAVIGEVKHTYLGVPIMATTTQHYDYLIDKVTAKLHPWKARMLSQAAKVVLIKSVIEPLVLYSMGAGNIPNSVLQKINSKIRAFFWNSGDTNKMRMVAWEKITSPKLCGGLGLRDVKVLNQAMTLKVLWKLASKDYEDALWIQVLNAKYLSRSSLWLAHKPSRCSKLWAAVLEAREVLRPHIKWILGNGEKCSLIGEPWHDFWLQFLQQSRRSFAGCVKDFVDADSGQWNTGRLVQALGFHAALYIVCVFQQPPLKPNSRDRLVFKSASSGNFSFKGACDMLVAGVNQGQVDAGIWKLVWHCSDILPKIQLFIWKLLHDALPVKASFARRMRTPAPPCDVCGLDEDDAMHVLFKCTKAKQCWLASNLGLRVDALPQPIVPALIFIFQQLNREQLVVFANTLWSIWKARCKEVYEGKKIAVSQVLRDASSLNTLTKFIEEPNRRRGISINTTIPSVQVIVETGKYCKIDGSYKEGGRAGWAYTLYENNVLIQYGLSTGDTTSPLHAELLALNTALHAALFNGWLEATFYTDCQTIAKVLNGALAPEAVDWRVYLLFLDIISTLKSHKNLICCYAPRELLVQEHELANIARIKGLNVIGYTFPLFGH